VKKPELRHLYSDKVSRLAEINRDFGLGTAISRAMKYGIDKPIRKIYSSLFEYRNGPGIDIMQEDWDNLIILDACRYDYFESQIGINGNLTSVISRGAHSWEFMKNNFVDRQFHDTIYVTANPYADRLQDDVFYLVENTLDDWDKKIETVHPQTIVERTVRAHRQNPNKKLIIHFMQPHIPYLGPTADEIRERIDLTGYGYHTATNKESRNEEKKTWWKALDRGEITEKEIKKCYEESLDIVLEEVKELTKLINGKSVVTSDHGEMLGERGLVQKRYGHPHDIYNNKLRKVPWFIINSDSQRNIISEEPIDFERIDFERIDKNKLDEHLKALGYKPE